MNKEICPICKKRTAEIITKNDAEHGRFVHIVACSSCGKINEIVEPYIEKSERKLKMIDCNKTINFLKEKDRMTNNCILGCPTCLLSSSNNGTGYDCRKFIFEYPEKSIEIVQKWSDEHPQKTYLSELLRAFPKAILDLDGKTPLDMCPSMLGLKEINNCHSPEDCIKCWNQPIEESEK